MIGSVRPLHVAALCAATLLLSCGGDGGGTEPDPLDAIATVVVSPAAATVDLGATTQLQATVRNGRNETVSGATVTWTSVDPQRASVSHGLVTGLAEGAVTIRATAGGRTGEAQITVNDPNPPASPSGLEVSPVSDTSVQLTWQDNSSNETEFRIEREEAGPAPAEPSEAAAGPARVYTTVATLGPGATSYLDEGLDPGMRYRYRLSACNANGCSSSTAAVEVDTWPTLTITTTSLPSGVRDVAYSETLEATGGDGTGQWSVVAGALPDGLTLDVDGTLAGTPTEDGEFTFTVQVEGAGQSPSVELILTIAGPPVVSTTSLPSGQPGVPYEATLEATGGDGSYTWSVTDGSLPTGLSLSEATGVISGTPTATGTFDFTVEVESAGLTGERALAITVSALPAVTVTTTSLPDGTEGAAYSEALAATGGDGTYTWAVTDGSLPTGLSLAAGTGVISGTPTAAGTFGFTVEATSAGLTGDQALTITIVALPPVTIANSFVRGGYEGAAYASGVTASGGDGSYAFEVVEGALPPGLALNASTGAITGVPEAGSAGAHHFVVQASSGSSSASHTYMLTISTVGAGAFNMIAHTVAPTIPTAAVRAALDWALERWEQVVTGDLPDFVTSSFTPAWCSGYGPEFNGVTIDDMEIMVAFQNIDGPGGTLGSAGPCAIRGGAAALTILGIVILDSSDLAGLDSTQLRALIFHEIGHIVGIGTLWNCCGNALLTGATGEEGGDPRYTGTEGVSAYKNGLGGLEPDIPVANTGGSGTVDGHWREVTFNAEIMTGYLEGAGVPQPVSIMTIASLKDLGYTVDLGAADGYSLPAPAPAGVAAFRTGDRLPLDDMLDLPVAVFMPDGRVVVVPPRMR